MTTETTEPMDIADMAGEYVLGVLSDSERDAFEQAMMRDEALRFEVEAWRNRLAPMHEALEPVAPPDSVWRGIQERIEPWRQQQPQSIWSSLSLWRGLTAVSMALFLGLALTFVGLRQQGPGMEQLMVVANDRQGPGWIVAAPMHGGYIQVSAMEPTDMPSDQVCQLWMETADGLLIPVGLLPHDGTVKMQPPTSVSDQTRFKVSIENATEAPVIEPSEQMVFEGRLKII